MSSPEYIPNNSDDDGQGLSLGDLIDAWLEQRWLVLVCALGITILASLYAFLARPVYEANLLIQVEDGNAGVGQYLGQQVAGLFELKTAASSEMEILRSRKVVARAVDAQRLHIEAQPAYFPLIGAWMARRATGLSTPGLWGWGGHVWGAEQIRVTQFEVPAELINKPIALIALGADRYTLQLPDGDQAPTGQVGQPLTVSTPQGRIELLVDQLEGQPGARFKVLRRSRLALIEELQRDLKLAEKGRQSGIIGASLEGIDPVATAAILNEIGNEYVRQNVERRSEEAGNTLHFLDLQLPQIKQQLEESEARYSQFRASQASVSLSEEAKALLQQTVQIETRALELKQKREELLVRYTAQHPQVVAIERQLLEVRKDSEATQRQIKRLPKVEQEGLRIGRDVKVNSELYANLLNSAQQLKLIRAGKVGNVRLVDPAVVPEVSVKPKRALLIGAGLALGLILGLGLAVLRKVLQAGIKDAAEIERRLGLSVYASIPHSPRQRQLSELVLRKKPGRHILAELDPFDAAVESLRSLRTAMQFQLLKSNRPVVLITGPVPGLGKSFISANLVAVMASSGERRVLLMDGDLRRGYLHQYFDLERKNGLSEHLAGRIDIDASIRSQVMPGLDFMPTGVLPPNPAELLTSPRLAELIQTLSERYDHIVIDSPPVMIVTDSSIIAPQVGAVFLVAREGQTTLYEIDEARRRLEQLGQPVAGVVFNDLHRRLPKYGLDYLYEYRYKYRYKYHNTRYGGDRDA